MDIKLHDKRYIQMLNYVNGINELNRVGSELKKYAGSNVFEGIEGRINFNRPSFSDYGFVGYTPYLKFSENDKRNKKLMNKFRNKLTKLAVREYSQTFRA